MASSTTVTPEGQQHDFHSGGGGGGVGWGSRSSSPKPPPPPPTPSNHHQSPASDGADNDDDTGAALSRVLERLLTPPKLSMSRFRGGRPNPSSASSASGYKQAAAKPILPLLSLRDGRSDGLLAASRELGFFRLSDHTVPAHLAESAIVESAAEIGLFSGGVGLEPPPPPLRVIDVAGGELGSGGCDKLKELVGCLEKVGLELVELLFAGNPFIGTRPRCLVGVSSSSWAAGCINGGPGDDQVAEWMKKSGVLGSVPPYVVCLQYETHGGMSTETAPWWVLGGDTVANSVETRPDSLLVALGDVAEVWSNGRFKKVRGVPMPAPSSSGGGDVASVSLLITLPAGSVVAPLPLPPGEEEGGGEKRFRAFTMEELGSRGLDYYERDWLEEEEEQLLGPPLSSDS